MGYDNKLPGWILTWFYVTAVICTWDASFIMCRPHSLPGGSLAYIWYFYKYYVVVDQRYNDVTDAFVFAQSLLNYVEVLFNVITIGMHYWNARHTRMLAFTVTVMTFWKTVLYFLMFTEFCGAGHYRVGITLMQEIFIFAIPNGVWILVPFLAIIKLWSMLVNPTVQVEEKNGFTGYNQHAYVPVPGKKHI